ncbi:MAG: hypothetical protein Q9191_007745, partial [Dirinaria sp. TL-2023a]
AAQDGQYLIYAICNSEPLVRWCLSHGARVSYPDADPNLNPPLTEVIATRGTVAILKLVLEHGAELGRRTLHRAVEGAASSSSLERRGPKMELVRFLVEELKVDINLMDVPDGEQRPNHWGTPMAYAVPVRQGTADQGATVVEYLLKNGADPRIKDCWGMFDVYGLAERMKNEKVMEVLRHFEAPKAT